MQGWVPLYQPLFSMGHNKPLVLSPAPCTQPECNHVLSSLVTYQAGAYLRFSQKEVTRGISTPPCMRCQSITRLYPGLNSPVTQGRKVVGSNPTGVKDFLCLNWSNFLFFFFKRLQSGVILQAVLLSSTYKYTIFHTN